MVSITKYGYQVVTLLCFRVHMQGRSHQICSGQGNSPQTINNFNKLKQCKLKESHPNSLCLSLLNLGIIVQFKMAENGK